VADNSGNGHDPGSSFGAPTDMLDPEEIKGYQELRGVFKQVMSMKHLRIYLAGFFFMTMGLLTTMFMASTYGTNELGLDDTVLIPTVIIIQLVAMFGAWLFAKISARKGNIKSLIYSILIWIGVIIGAFFIQGPLVL